MPIYEYICSECESNFDALRPMSQADAPIACPKCGSKNARRGISIFAAVARSDGGETRAISGMGSGCASCHATSCASCSR